MDSKKFLGNGGFANVYQVTRKSDGAQVALKISQRPLIGMEESEKIAFKREADAMQKFSNPFIIKIFEAFELDNHYYLATELAD